MKEYKVGVVLGASLKDVKRVDITITTGIDTTPDEIKEALENFKTGLTDRAIKNISENMFEYEVNNGA
jgi:hypothetical protein